MKCALRHLEPQCECDHMCKVHEKKRVRCICLHVRGFPSSLVSTSAVGTVLWRTPAAPAAAVPAALARFSAAVARLVASRIA